jgi:hypothetical protein
MMFSEDHICCHVNLARFMILVDFMIVGFYTYNLFRTYENAREHVVIFEIIPQSLQPDGGLKLSPGPLYVSGGLPIRQFGAVHQVHRHRHNHGLERYPHQKSRSIRYVNLKRHISK